MRSTNMTLILKTVGTLIYLPGCSYCESKGLAQEYNTVTPVSLEAGSLNLNSNVLNIGNAFEIHKQVKTNDIMSQHLGNLMTPLSRNEINESEFKKGNTCRFT